MKRWFIRIATALFAAVIVLVSLVWLTVRSSLPQLDGNVVTEAVSSPVSIVRDANGIPTITADNRLDVAYGLGFAHGQDRFFQMDLLRRSSAGELSELLGSATVEIDRHRRLHRFRSRAQSARDVLTAHELGVLRRYAVGVNAGLASLDAKPFEYYLLGVEPEPWAAEDALLVAYAMFFDLHDERATRDQQRGMIAKVLSNDVVEWLDPVGTPWDAPLVGDALPSGEIPGPDVLSLRDVALVAGEFDEAGPRPVLGSNNWAVSGDLTESGRALVSNDMHLGLRVPNIYYRARLVVTGSPNVDVSGVSLPGQPLIIAGSNGHMAWGYTNSNGDWTDAVLIQPGDAPGTYRTPEGDLPFDIYEESIGVKGDEAVQIAVRETIWGPVDDRAMYPDGEIAISWIAHHTDMTNLGILQLETARSAKAAMEIANTIAMPPQNFVVGDENGNIGWTIAGQIPLRADFDPNFPADWSEQHGWPGWVAPADYPRIYNPENGRIWTANTRVVAGDELRMLGDSGYAFGARGRQIRDELFARDTFSPQDMLDIQNDDRALYMAEWREVLLKVLAAHKNLEPELLELRRLVEDWVPRAVAESVGYRLVRAYRNEVRRQVFHAISAPVREAYGEDPNLNASRQFDGPLWSIIKARPVHLLPKNFADWDQFMLEAARNVVAEMEQNGNGNLADRTWGEYNTARIHHPMSAALPFFGEWLNMPAEPLRGDSDMPRAQGATWGASERFSVFPGDEENSLLQMPGGQSGHPMSDFYRIGHKAWVDGTAAPFLPGRAKYELNLLPATR
ncbi:MAG: penicillin acylase family protein [Woeseiaceae bacterium]